MNKIPVFSVTKKDFDITYFSGSGAGGQHRNRHMNYVRMYHKESGVRSTGQIHKERKSNIKEAFKNITNNPTFKAWLNLKSKEIMSGSTVEEDVKIMMHPDNILTEYKKNNKWVGDNNG